MSSSSKRTVTFNPTVTGVETISIYDYTPSEIAASWYNDEEMENITRRCVGILRKMDNSTAFKGGLKYCTRGLEGHTTLGSINKKKNRATALAAVLDAQAIRQRKKNEVTIVDSQDIADVYRKTTSSCQMWANVIGNRDQSVAEDILNEDDSIKKQTNFSMKSRTELLIPSTSSEQAINVQTDNWQSTIASRAA